MFIIDQQRSITDGQISHADTIRIRIISVHDIALRAMLLKFLVRQSKKMFKRCGIDSANNVAHARLA